MDVVIWKWTVGDFGDCGGSGVMAVGNIERTGKWK